MKFKDFEYTMSSFRMSRYLKACNNNSQKAMTLYRKNLKLSHGLFTIISCFEVALRNAIDRCCLTHLGQYWLYYAVCNGGIFDNAQCIMTAKTIQEALQASRGQYTHNKLVADLGFGFWRYLFSPHQYRATGQHLLSIFVARPPGNAQIKYNALYVFNRLAEINKIRNRIAHHEPICFLARQSVKNTAYARQQYEIIVELFRWLEIDEGSLLYGLDHISSICYEIDNL